MALFSRRWPVDASCRLRAVFCLLGISLQRVKAQNGGFISRCLAEISRRASTLRDAKLVGIAHRPVDRELLVRSARVDGTTGTFRFMEVVVARRIVDLAEHNGVSRRGPSHFADVQVLCARGRAMVAVVIERAAKSSGGGISASGPTTPLYPLSER